METKIKNLDDLIFEKRNRNYGAYANRKNYPRYMMWSLIAATTLFFMGISIPLIANYVNRGKGNEKSVTIICDTLTRIKENKVIIKIPEPPKAKIVEHVFTPPRVIVDTNNVTPDFADIHDKATNGAISDTIIHGEGEPVDKTPPVIEPATKETYVSVKEMPEFPGGDAGRIKFLSENVHYSEIDREVGIQGHVYISFVVDETGKVVEVKLMRGIGGDCDKEALRVMSIMPNWKPGRQNGMAVRVRFTMAINFVLKQ